MQPALALSFTEDGVLAFISRVLIFDNFVTNYTVTRLTRYRVILPGCCFWASILPSTSSPCIWQSSHFYTLLLCKSSSYCDWLSDSELFPYEFLFLFLCKSSAVIGWSDSLGEVDMSHITLLPCRKLICLISTSSYLGYKANQEILKCNTHLWKRFTASLNPIHLKFHFNVTCR